MKKNKQYKTKFPLKKHSFPGFHKDDCNSDSLVKHTSDKNKKLKSFFLQGFQLSLFFMKKPPMFMPIHCTYCCINKQLQRKCNTHGANSICNLISDLPMVDLTYIQYAQDPNPLVLGNSIHQFQWFITSIFANNHQMMVISC